MKNKDLTSIIFKYLINENLENFNVVLRDDGIYDIILYRKNSGLVYKIYSLTEPFIKDNVLNKLLNVIPIEIVNIKFVYVDKSKLNKKVLDNY